MIANGSLGLGVPDSRLACLEFLSCLFLSYLGAQP